MKKITYSILVAALALVACKKTPEITIPDDQKEKISFSLSDGTTGTKAGFTVANTRIVARFQSDEKGTTNTKYTRTIMQAAVGGSGADDFSVVSYPSVDNTRYWDDAYGRKAQVSVYAVAIPNSTDNSKLAETLVHGGSTWAKEDTPDNTISWSVTATAQTTEILAAEDLVYSNNIQEDANLGINGRYVWNYTTNPEGYPADNGRLDGHSNGRLQFTQKEDAQASDAGHFDKGHMMFNHSLTRLTVVLTPGTGFATDRSSATDFKFNKIVSPVTTGNITLLKFPVKGKLDLKGGAWTTDSDGTQNINQMVGAAATTSATEPAAQYNSDAATYLANRTYSAQMLPGKVFSASGTANVMQFTIDDNTYYITEKMAYDALASWFDGKSDKVKSDAGFVSGTSLTMSQGHNYTLNITVTKTGIANVTATLAPWVDVAGETTAKNDYVKISIKDATSTACDHFDLYRLNDDQSDIYAPTTGPGTGTDWTPKYNWYGNYTDKATLSPGSATGVWKTTWFWESNKSFYHFRTVNTGLPIQGASGDGADTTNDYFNVYGGPIQDYDDSHSTISSEQNDGKVNDYHWGAPFKSTVTTMTYTPDYGWSASTDAAGQIYPAIGSTSDQINMIEHHMMSNIKIILKTPRNAENTSGHYLGEGAVDLGAGETKTSITLTNFANDGTVEMGRGKVTPGSTLKESQLLTVPSTFFKTAGDYTETREYTYRVVPQNLYRGTNAATETDLAKFVGLSIKTPDNNQYYVIKKLGDITASTISAANANELAVGGKIERWLPGYNYTYTINISKKGIESITCSVVDWVNVTGSDIDIDLED